MFNHSILKTWHGMSQESVESCAMVKECLQPRENFMKLKHVRRIGFDQPPANPRSCHAKYPHICSAHRQYFRPLFLVSFWTVASRAGPHRHDGGVPVAGGRAAGAALSTPRIDFGRA
jgi:hypothetical protein